MTIWRRGLYREPCLRVREEEPDARLVLCVHALYVRKQERTRECTQERTQECTQNNTFRDDDHLTEEDANPSTDSDLNGANEDEEDYLPLEWFCPLTHELFTDPVVAADGHTYERSAITDWWSTGHTTSPMTNEILDSHVLVCNRVLRSWMSRLTVSA